MRANTADQFASKFFQNILYTGVLSEASCEVLFQSQKNVFLNNKCAVSFSSYIDSLDHTNKHLTSLGFEIKSYVSELSGIRYFGLSTTDYHIKNTDLEFYFRNSSFSQKEILQIKEFLSIFIRNNFYLKLFSPLSLFDQQEKSISIVTNLQTIHLDVKLTRKLIQYGYIEITNTTFLTISPKFFLECQTLLNDIIRDIEKNDNTFEINICAICRKNVYYYVLCADSICRVKMHEYCYRNWKQDQTDSLGEFPICPNLDIEKHPLELGEDGNFKDITG